MGQASRRPDAVPPLMLMLPKPEEYRRRAEELETQARRTRDLKAPSARM
jgi:hypothetical protein